MKQVIWWPNWVELCYANSYYNVTHFTNNHCNYSFFHQTPQLPCCSKKVSNTTTKMCLLGSGRRPLEESVPLEGKKSFPENVSIYSGVRYSKGFATAVAFSYTYCYGMSSNTRSAHRSLLPTIMISHTGYVIIFYDCMQDIMLVAIFFLDTRIINLSMGFSPLLFVFSTLLEWNPDKWYCYIWVWRSFLFQTLGASLWIPFRIKSFSSRTAWRRLLSRLLNKKQVVDFVDNVLNTTSLGVYFSSLQLSQILL